MKTFLAAAGIAAFAAAAPNHPNLKERQLGGYAKFDLEKGPCKDVTLIWARGTTEIANIGSYVGFPLLNVLAKKGIKDLAVQGVTYGAGVMTNIVSAGGADPDGVKDGARLFKLAASKCPDTVIIGGGYSQGAAIMHLAAKGLPNDVESHM
jgi:cutinase